ncbi:ParA family protein [bacterium]|nr:ParA family protein [bacterium]
MNEISAEQTAARRAPVIISVTNQKGGVGKTTTVMNLGAALAQRGFRTLVVDLDLQANLTHCLAGPPAETAPNMCEVMLGEQPLSAVLMKTATPRLFLAPAGESMANLEINLVSTFGREQALRTALAQPVAAEFDFVIIDNPPHLSITTINSLVASDHVLIPVSCEYLPMLGLKWLLKTVDKVRSRLHPRLSVLGYLLTMYDLRIGITRQAEEILREQFGDAVCATVIRINVRHKAAPAEHKTIFEYEHSSSGKGSGDYDALSCEVLNRLHMPARAHAGGGEEVANVSG